MSSFDDNTLVQHGGKMDETITKKELLKLLEKYNDNDKIYSFDEYMVKPVYGVSEIDTTIHRYKVFVWPSDREKKDFKEPIQKEDTFEKLICIDLWDCDLLGDRD